jgi:hypothetical protein
MVPRVIGAGTIFILMNDLKNSKLDQLVNLIEILMHFTTGVSLIFSLLEKYGTYTALLR